MINRTTSLSTWFVVLITFVLLFFGCNDNPTETQDGSEPRDLAGLADQATQPQMNLEDHYIVVLKENASIDKVTGTHGISATFRYSHALNGFAAYVKSDQVLQALKKNPRVQYVEKDRAVHAVDQTLQAGVDRLQIDQNTTANIDNNDDAMDVDIGILDTGIDLDHPDLDVQAGKDCIDDGKSTTNDDNGHGTHVAGSAGAIDNSSHTVGAAPGARVHAIKVLDSGGGGSISSVVCGIDYVTANASTFEVANMSLGAQGTSNAMRTAIQSSVDAGVYYAVAAGNDGADVYGGDGTFGTSDDFIPAAYPEVAAVSAMAEYDGSSGGNGGSLIFQGCGKVEDDTFADCFSNYSQSVISSNPVNSPGAAIDVAAPGVAVLSTTNNGGTGEKTGTSMSSPHVAGVAALYIVEKGLSPSSASDVYAVRQALIDNGQPQSNWQGGDTKDPDNNPEPLVQAIFGSDSPPSVNITNPSDGATVSGDVSVTADASDDNSVSQVEFFVDGSSIGTDSNGGDGWTATWTTTDYSDGDYPVTAKATDDNGQTASDQITATVDNVDEAPTVSWINPSDGATVSGTVSIQISASDDRDNGSNLTVEWQVDDGTWQTATYDSGCDCYTDSWDSGTVSDGSHDLDTRATDTGSNTSSESRITVTVDNTTEIGMHVGDLDGNSINNGSTWTAEVTATVHDPQHGPLGDATVSFSWDSRDNSGTAQCTTSSDGTCMVSVSGLLKRSSDAAFTVENVAHTDYKYDASANHDPDSDSDGSIIVVQKP